MPSTIFEPERNYREQYGLLPLETERNELQEFFLAELKVNLFRDVWDDYWIHANFLGENIREQWGDDLLQRLYLFWHLARGKRESFVRGGGVERPQARTDSDD